MIAKTFGKLPSGERLTRIQQSPNFKKGSFQNTHPTPMMSEDGSFWKTLALFLNKPRDTRPPVPLPFVKTDLNRLSNDFPVIVWFGHSSYLLRINGKNILVDPVFSNHAAPFSFMVKAYAGADTYRMEDMPEIDVLLQTHDHYDHLDYESITALMPKVKKVVTGLGTGTHFEYWGYNTNSITELDWWETTTPFPGINITATPARHFSGRSVHRGKSLWSSFVLKTATHTIFLGGDSGYDDHFKKIGERFGPFDIALLECGQYNLQWKHIHMMPEETVQAAIDLKTKMLLPVHWGKFTLALHPWNEPIKRVVKEAAALSMRITTPLIGEPVSIGNAYPGSHWWEI